jgi:hypothetical protein
VVTPDLKFQPLYYEVQLEEEAEMVTNIATNPVLMTFDQDQQDTYIGNGLRCFVLSRTGLGETPKIPTGLITYNSSLWGYYVDKTASLKDGLGTVYLQTNDIDFAERMLKSIHDVEIGAYDCSSMYVRTLYRTSGGMSGWRYSDWILVVDGGFNVQLIEGHNVALEIKYTPGTNARFEYAKINWQRRDQRNFRSQQWRH